MLLKITLAGLCVACNGALAAPFVNMDFQGAFPNGEFDGVNDLFPPEVAIPGWTPRLDEEVQSIVLITSILLGSPAVCLFDINNAHPGSPQWQILLYTSAGESFPVASISQMGDIPPDAQRIQMYCRNLAGPIVKLDGVNVPMINLGNSQWAGDVSTFGGRMVDLRIAAPRQGYGSTFIDDIQFSSTAIPEPDFVVAAIALGAAPRRRRHADAR